MAIATIEQTFILRPRDNHYRVHRFPGVDIESLEKFDPGGRSSQDMQHGCAKHESWGNFPMTGGEQFTQNGPGSE
jgi:hypothetical protein